MKIIQVDGYGRDSEPDILILSDLELSQGQILLEIMQNTLGSDSVWFQLVKDDYVLSRGIEDLI